MKIAVLSDIHDNVWQLKTILTSLEDCETMFCCGDLCSPFIVDLIVSGYNGEIHIVFGNNDGDLFRITEKVAKSSERVYVYGDCFDARTKDGKDLLFDGRKCFLTHYREIALPVAISQEFDLVCYGHNHRIQVEYFSNTLLINPGAVMGYQPQGDISIPSTFMKYDTHSHKAHAFQVTEDDTVIPYDI
jgi:putative phosphoesterase